MSLLEPIGTQLPPLAGDPPTPYADHGADALDELEITGAQGSTLDAAAPGQLPENGSAILANSGRRGSAWCRGFIVRGPVFRSVWWLWEDLGLLCIPKLLVPWGLSFGLHKLGSPRSFLEVSFWLRGYRWDLSGGYI